MRTLLDSLQKYLEGNLAKHKANIEVYLAGSIGIGEHSDIVETIEKELDMMASYHDKLEVLDKYFIGKKHGTKELLNERT